MKKLRLAAAVVLLTASLSGAFSAPAQANPWQFPWCWEDFQYCIQQMGMEEYSYCYCYYQMCIGGICP